MCNAIRNFIVVIMIVTLANSLLLYEYKRYQGWKINTPSNIRTYNTWAYNTTDQVLCEHQCIKDEYCLGVYFKDIRCLIIDDAEALDYTGGLADEISMLKGRLGSVFRVQAYTNLLLSNWTVDAARALCETLGFHLFTHSNMVNMMNTTSYSSSSCGWIEGGTVKPERYLNSMNETVFLKNCTLDYKCGFCQAV